LFATKKNSGFIKYCLVISFLLNFGEAINYLVLIIINSERIELISIFTILKLGLLVMTEYRTQRILDIIDNNNKNTE